MSNKKYLDLTGVGNLINNVFSQFVKTTDFNSHKNDTTAHMTSGQKSNLTTAYNHSQSSHAPTNAEKNTIVGVQKNGTDLTIDSITRKVNITVPTKISELTNDSGFITSDTNTTNTTGSTNTLNKIFLVGATSQASAPVTYSHDTAYVGTDGCLYSNSTRVVSEVTQSTEPTIQKTGDYWIIEG